MKNLICILSVIFLFSVLFFSCNKDTTTPTSNNSNTGPVTSTFNSNPGLNKFITNAQPVFDTINANITDNITSNNISSVKITLGEVSSVEVNKIKFSILHNGIEVGVIDSLTKSGIGNFTNTVLWDSALTHIDQEQSPYTGTFKPQNPLSSFNNSDPAGNWIIIILYSGTLKTGVIKSWGITITYLPIQIPTLTSAYYPSIGDNWKFKRADTTSPSFKLTGENVTWDFTNLAINTSFEYTDEYVQPIISPLFWHFSQSNLAKRNFDLNGNFLSFFKTDLNQGTFITYGEADSNGIDGLKLYQLSPYLLIASSPLTYNSLKIDSGLTHGVRTGYTSNGKFIDTVKADGWGKILLPGGVSYNNVLRVRTVIATMDTINSSGISFSYNERISWHIIGYKFPVLQYNFDMSYSTSYGTSWNKNVNFTTQNVPILKK